MAPIVPEISESGALCYVKERWADEWTEASLLECLTVRDQAAPGHASAVFRWRYGLGHLPAIGSRPADSSPTVIAPSDLAGWYVRVDHALWSWWGQFTDVDDTREGEIEWGESTVPSGVQTYHALAVSLLLDQRTVEQTVVGDDDDAVGVINDVVIVNAGTSRKLADGRNSYSGNKSAGGLWFAESGGGLGNAWTALQFLGYLINAFNAGSVIEVELTVNAGLNYYLPEYDPRGKTLWQILRELIPRTRGLGFNVYVNATTEKLVIEPWSYSPVLVSLPSGDFTIPASTKQASLDLTGYVNVSRERVSQSLIGTYDQVVVVGEPRGSVCTLQPYSHFDPDWTEDEETDYNEAAIGSVGFDELSAEEQAERNQKVRSQDTSHRIFSWWKLRSDWDGIVEDASGGEFHVFPQIASNGTIDFEDGPSAFTWISALRIADYVPIRAVGDYSGEVTPETGSGDFLPMPVWFEKVLAERLDYEADSDDIAEPRTWTVSTRVMHDVPGVRLEVSGGRQHFIASDLYVPNGDYEEIRDIDRAIDSADWLATVYLIGTDRIIGAWPVELPDVDTPRVFRVDGSGYYFDTIVPGTVVDVKPDESTGEPEYVETEGGILRDHRAALLDEARRVYEWVGKPRKILDIELQSASVLIPVGTLYTTINGTGGVQTVNSVVTSVEIDLENGTTSFVTQAAELDL